MVGQHLKQRKAQQPERQASRGLRFFEGKTSQARIEPGVHHNALTMLTVSFVCNADVRAKNTKGAGTMGPDPFCRQYEIANKSDYAGSTNVCAGSTRAAVVLALPL
jgi:hypothetical protein